VSSLITAHADQPNIKQPDAATLQKLNEGREEDKFLKADQVRLMTPSKFPEVTLVGFLVGPNECIVGKAIVEGKLISPGEACGIALRKRGWEQATGPAKIALATEWLEDAQLGFGERLVKSKPEGFNGKEALYSPVEALATLSGSVRIMAWIEYPPSPSPGRRFRRSLFWFGKDGRISRIRVLETLEL